MTMLLTGAGGFVGARIAAHAPVVAAPSLRNATQEDVARLIDTVQPEVIIHTAAMSDIGTCAKNPEGSYHANVLIPVYLAKAAPKAKLLLFSTDQVYSGHGDGGPYTEDNVKPANLYAEHKLEMERRVLDISPDAVMLRATWMYDMPIYGVSNRGNFLMNMLNAAMRGQTQTFSDASWRGLTYVREVAEMTVKAIGLPGGAYNFGSSADVTMFGAAQLLKEELGLRLDLQASADVRNLWMDDAKLRAQGLAFLSTTEGIKRCIADYQLK